MYYIFSFKSRQEAMRLHNSAKRAGISTNLISTPKFVYPGCGLSVKIDSENYPRLYNLFVSMSFTSFYGAFRVKQDANGINSDRIMY
jgi:hypothetical protein